MRWGQICVCTAAFPPQLQKMQEVMRHTPGRGLFHIHLLIHAHCISICFPPITNITQSQSLSPHIFHLSLSPLSSINLNIRTPTERFRENAAVRGGNERVHWCVQFPPLSSPSLCVSRCLPRALQACRRQIPAAWKRGRDAGVSPAPGESGRMSPSGGLFKC